MKVEEPVVPVITIPSAEAVAAALQASAALTEHVVAEAVAEEAAEQALAARLWMRPPLTKLSRLRKQTLNPSPK